MKKQNQDQDGGAPVTPEELVQTLQNGEYERWKGLSAMPFSALKEYLDIDPPEFNAVTGRGYYPVRRSGFFVPGLREPLTVFHAEDRITKVMLDFPEVRDVQQLLEKLGAPTEKLDYWLDVLEVEKGEWVYPGRGLALRLNEPRNALMSVILCDAMDMSTYLDRVHFTEQAIEFPFEDEMED